MARRRSHVQTHVAFGDSASGGLVQGLRTMGRHGDRIINIREPFNVGPIAPGMSRDRVRWADAHDLWWPRPTIIARVAGARNRVARSGIEAVIAAEDPIVWISHRAAHEYCGLMEVLWRRRRPIFLIDVATFPFPRFGRYQNQCFALLSQQSFAELQLLDHARLVAQREVDAFAATWQTLADEGHPLRVVGRHGLLGVPLDHFDDVLVALSSVGWLRAIVLIGHMLGGFSNTGYHQVDPEFLFSRIANLVDHDRLEGRGDFGSFRTCEVRAPRRGHRAT